MGEEIAFDNVRISDFEGLVTLTLTLIGSYFIPSCITRRPLLTNRISLKSKKLIVDGWTDGRTFETHFIRSTQRSRPKNLSERYMKDTTPLQQFDNKCYRIIYDYFNTIRDGILKCAQKLTKGPA